MTERDLFVVVVLTVLLLVVLLLLEDLEVLVPGSCATALSY